MEIGTKIEADTDLSLNQDERTIERKEEEEETEQDQGHSGLEKEEGRDPNREDETLSKAGKKKKTETNGNTILPINATSSISRTVIFLKSRGA